MKTVVALSLTSMTILLSGCEKWRKFEFCNFEYCKNTEATYKIVGTGTADEALDKCELEGLPRGSNKSLSMLLSEFAVGGAMKIEGFRKAAGQDVYKYKELLNNYKETEFYGVNALGFWQYDDFNKVWPGSQKPLIFSARNRNFDPKQEAFIICFQPDSRKK